MPPDKRRFDVGTIDELAQLLKVTTGEISYALPRLRSFYRRQDKVKPNGDIRTLWKPQGTLRKLQDAIKNEVLAKVKFPSWVQGGVMGRSVRTNAVHHVGRPFLSTMDIHACFPSINPHKVRRVFDDLFFSGDALGVITKLTTWEYQLPQGAPTSPAIANLALASLDRRQIGLAKQHQLTYTRYVDDMGCSGGRRLPNVRNLQERIVVSEGYAIKPLKPGQKKIMRREEDRQELTGLVLNEKANLPREKRNAILQEAKLAVRKIGKLTQAQQGRVSWIRSVNPDLSIAAAPAATETETRK